MTLIYIPVEVPEGDLNDLLTKLTEAQVAQYAPAPVATAEPADPWADEPIPPGESVPPGTTTAPSRTAAPAAAPPVRPATSSVPAAGGPPSCPHGPMKFVEGGFSRKTGRPYPAFYACASRDPACKGVNA